jgi:hypothetical protein
MSENTKPQTQAEQELDDLGLSHDDWQYLAMAYNYGLIEPAEGTVEAEVLRRMDAYARREAEQVGWDRERERNWSRQHHHEAEAEA